MAKDMNFISPDGVLVDVDALVLPRAKQCAVILASGILNFTRLLECRVSESGGRHEILVIEVDVQRPQKRVHDIHSCERIAVIFDESDSQIPETLSLREDFPRVAHLNLRRHEKPRSLCLEERPWDDMKLDWTVPGHIELIRSWLSRTSRGELHQPDQPLEPLLFGSGYHIVIPDDVTRPEAGGGQQKLHIVLRGTTEEGRVLVARHLADAPKDAGGLAFASLTLECGPVVHGVIWSCPETIQELIALVIDVGLDLRDQLLRGLTGLQQDDAKSLDSGLVLIIRFLKQRDVDQKIEAIETKAFLTFSTVRDIGVALGCWAIHDGHAVPFVGGDMPSPNGEGIPIITANVHHTLTPSGAAYLNGRDFEEPVKVAAIGAGALGSQLQMNLARAGFGQWTIIDDDWFFPHNIARHELNKFAVGQNKALGVAAELNCLHDGEQIASMLPANILRPGGMEELVSRSLNEADVILDAAASVPVSRHLAKHASNARRVSVFLNPTGTDLVLLAEDKDRRVRLDCLEMQYYRLMATRAEMAHHLELPAGQVRYGLGCRDLSSRMPQDLLSIHAGIGSRAVQTTLASNDARLEVWQVDAPAMTVSSVNAEPMEVFWQEHPGGWLCAIDKHVLQRVADLREANLPNETGGVLIGAYDMASKIVYVVDALDAPPDSEQWPTLYVRGSDFLAERIAKIEKATAGRLVYIGEWHSHPDGCPTLPSGDDVKVFSWLTQHLAVESKPALMLIAGQHRASRLFLWEIADKPEELS